MNPILAGIALKSVALLSAASIAAWMIRKSPAALRHLLWAAALAGLLALPFLSLSLPSLHFASTDRMIAPIATFTADAIAPAAQSPSSPARGGASDPARSRRAPRNLGAILWGIGAAIGCARLLIACAMVARLRSRSRLVAGSPLADLASEIGVRGVVELRETSPGSMPMTAGLLRPAIFLPSGAAEWSREKRRAVLLHELAHVRRGDVITQILAGLAANLYWWNPLAWFAWRELLKMRELAADDLVLGSGASATEYARHLLDIARSSAAPAPTALAAIAMAQPSQLETRLAAILDARTRRGTPGRFAVAAMIAGAAVLIAPLAAIHAQDADPPPDAATTIRIATSQNNFEMLDRAAGFFVKKGQYDTARKLLDASLQVRANVAGKQSATYADGLMKLGDLQWDHERLGNAKGSYEQAVALGDGPDAAQALLRLGIFNFNDASQAETYLQRSINSGARGNVYGEALAWMAEVRSAQGNAAEAESLFSRAQSAVKDESEGQALVREMYAAYLAGHGRGEEAPAFRSPAEKFRTVHIASLSPAVAGSANAKKLSAGGLKPPTVLKKIEPVYSQEARALKIQGTVTLGLVIGADGTAGNVTLKRSLGFGLDEAALAAVSQWKFNPATEDGTPVPVLATIEVNFRLL